MCSYQNISEAYFGSCLSENWEDNLWTNTMSPNSNISDTSTSHSHISDVASEIIYGENVVSLSQDYKVDTSKTVQSPDLTSILPAACERSVSAPQSCTNMSTYFSTFNPSSQIQEVVIHQSPVRHEAVRWNKPQARINLVPSKNGNFKAIIKRKRKRTIFTTEQIQVLEEVYSKKPYVTRDERQTLVQQLQVNDKSVKIWFQNRRLKNKRGDNEEKDEVIHCSIYDRMDAIESKIKERTDEFGYVTLDDKIVNELVNVIDDYFTNNVSSVNCKKEMDHSPIYEPISPASTSDISCDDTPSWQHCDSSVIVQDLMDIESIITSKTYYK